MNDVSLVNNLPRCSAEFAHRTRRLARCNPGLADRQSVRPDGLRMPVMKTRDTPLSRRRFIAQSGTAMALTLSNLPFVVRAAASEKTNIGMVGSGDVGSELGRVWAKAGHEVMFSSRHIDHDKALAAEVGSNARAGTPREAASFGEVVVLSVPYRAVPELGKSLADVIAGKVLIDTCNPFPGRDGDIANWAREKEPASRPRNCSKALASCGPSMRSVPSRMGEAHETPGRIGMPIAGDDARAIEVASRLIRDIGYEPVLIGGLAMGKYLMPGTPLAGEHTPDEIRRIAAKLQ